MNHDEHSDAKTADQHDRHRKHADGPPGDHEAQGEHGGHGMGHAGHEILFRNRFFICLALTIPVLAYSDMLQTWLGFSAPTFPGSGWITPAFSALVFAVGGVPFLRMAAPEVRDRQPGMMTLISMAILAAFGFSLATLVTPLSGAFFWEVVTLIDVMLLGHWIEMRSVRQASGALDELAKLLPDEAERITEGGVETVSVSNLAEGDLVLVRPGHAVPADGIIQEGTTELDESMITGESAPVEKAPGDDVIGGTVNAGGGSLRVALDAVGDDTALAGIMRLVRDAQESKSRTQTLADRAAGWLFYIALAVAALTLVAWTLLGGFGAQAMQRTVTVLVIACPHALGLAVPLVVAITTAMGARNGILVRDRLALERARDVDAVIFDKTGTLTKGETGLADMAVVDGVDEDGTLALAAAVEGDSEHHLARAIREAAEERSLDLPKVSDFEALKGRGVRAVVDGRSVHVGGPGLLEERGAVLPDRLRTFAEEQGARARTVIHVIDGDEPIAAFALADVIRTESKEAVDALHEMGVRVVMLTGDSEEVARAVAEELGIDEVFAEVLPEKKAAHVEELVERGETVAMVGDGVNDAPALATADVGIAIGAGTDVAIESAGLILVRSDPRDVVRIIRLGRASYSKMIQNLWWASGYNVVALPLAAGVLAPWGILLSPAIGALVMSASTVIVALNAQLLRRVDLTA